MPRCLHRNFKLMQSFSSEKYCLYYVAHLDKSKCWLVSSLLRGTEHVAFDRSYDPENSIFEFFVPEAMESIFLEVMHYLEKEKVVSGLTKQENRLKSDQ